MGAHYTYMRKLGALLAVAACVLASAGRPRKDSREWNSMNDADWRRVERELEEPEDKVAREAAEEKAQRKARGPTVDMDALNRAKTQEERNKILSAAAAAHTTPGKGMSLGYVFVTVRFDGCCSSDRKEITQLGRKWSSLLASTGMDAAASISKDDQLSFETKHENHVRAPLPPPCLADASVQFLLPAAGSRDHRLHDAAARGGGGAPHRLTQRSTA